MEENINILYEIGGKFNFLLIIPIIAFIIFIAFSLILPKTEKIKNSEKNLKLTKYLTNTLALCTIAAALILGIFETVEYKTIMDGSSEEKILYAEGAVSNYTVNPDKTESFKVGETEFSFDPNKFDYGYNISASKGGLINNGDDLKIGYTVYKGENKIVYIELIPKEIK